MDVRLPNGTIIKNVPEGTTKKQLLDKLQAKGFDITKLTAPAAPQPPAPEPAPAEPTFGEQAADFGRGVLRGAASTADIIAEGIPGTAAMLAYPFRRAAGIVTGETAEDIAASQERVLGAVAQPIGRVTGVAETPEYQENALRQAVTFVAENLDEGADYLSKVTGLPKSDVANMMQVALTAAPMPNGYAAGILGFQPVVANSITEALDWIGNTTGPLWPTDAAQATVGLVEDLGVDRIVVTSPGQILLRVPSTARRVRVQHLVKSADTHVRVVCLTDELGHEYSMKLPGREIIRVNKRSGD